MSDPFDAIATQAREYYDQVDGLREQALTQSRRLVRRSAHTIRAVHRGEFDHAREMLRETTTLARQLRELTADTRELAGAGFVFDGLKEHAEAGVTLSAVCGEPLPSPDDLHVDVASYMNGLGEAIGEVRRHVLDSIRAGDLERAEALLGWMDDVYNLLMSYDYPDAVTHGLRRRSDAARGMVERTRGDVTLALENRRVTDAVERLMRQASAAQTGHD